MDRGFRSFHPAVNFIYIIGALLLISIEQHPVFLFVDVCVLGSYLVVLDHGHYLKQWGWSMLVLAIFFLFLNPLLNHQGTHVLFFWGPNPIMLEAVMRGIMTALTLVNLFFLLALFNQIITSEKFLFLFSRLFPQWALLLMVSLRFVPSFKRRLKEIELVQKWKGISVLKGNLKKRLQSGIYLLQILLSWSLEEAIGTADSMVARGYGLRKRSQYNPYFFRMKDILFLVIWGILFSLNLFGWWLGDSVLSLMPVLETYKLQGREWLYLAINFVYFGFPFLTELKERWRWQF